MSEVVNIHYISVSKLIKLYFDIDYSRVNYKRAVTGIKEHNKNGYTNKKIYERYYQVDLDNILLVRGVPDRIDPPYIIEFKTTTVPNLERVVNYSEIQTQLYMWLTGLQRGRIDIYLTDRKKFFRGYKYLEYNEDLAEEVIKIASEKIL
ncbi:MAG TPA: hypothetical protein EYH22_03520 [Candidatus Nanopusillus sp.]|nr:hypothetical protein [Candidatus Nanopusillus sp.]